MRPVGEDEAGVPRKFHSHERLGGGRVWGSNAVESEVLEGVDVLESGRPSEISHP